MERIPYVLLVKDRSESSESVLFLFDESGSADEFEKKNSQCPLHKVSSDLRGQCDLTEWACIAALVRC